MSPVSWCHIFTLPLRGDRIMELRHPSPRSWPILSAPLYNRFGSQSSHTPAVRGDLRGFRRQFQNESRPDWPRLDGPADRHEFVESGLSADGVESYGFARE